MPTTILPASYYPATPIAASIQRLGHAYLASRKSPEEVARLEAEAGLRAAQTRDAEAQAKLNELKYTGLQGAAGAITPNMDPAGLAVLGQNMARSGDLSNLGNVLLAALSINPNATPDALIRARTGAGLVTKPGEGVTAADRAQEGQTQQGYAMEKTAAEQAGQNARQGMADAGALERTMRQIAAQVNIADADRAARAAAPVAVSSGASLMTPLGRVIQTAPVAPSADVARPVTLSAGQELRSATGELLATNTNPATSGAPLDVTADDWGDIEWAALTSIPGAVVEGPEGDPTMSPDLMATLDPARLAAARQVGSQTYQASRNAAAAQQAFLQALGIAPGTTFQPAQDGWFSDTPAQMAGPTAAAPAAPAPGPAAPSPATVPPPAQRVVGRIYDTPRGPMAWTGTGWLPQGGA